MVRGWRLRLSTGIRQREQLLKTVSSLTFFILPPRRPVGGVSIKHYLSLCGRRTLKTHPRSYITNSGRRWIYCTQRNTMQCFQILLLITFVFYCKSKQNVLLLIVLFFQKFNQFPRDNFCGATTRWQGLIRCPSGKEGVPTSCPKPLCAQREGCSSKWVVPSLTPTN